MFVPYLICLYWTSVRFSLENSQGVAGKVVLVVAIVTMNDVLHVDVVVVNNVVVADVAVASAVVVVGVFVVAVVVFEIVDIVVTDAVAAGGIAFARYYSARHRVLLFVVSWTPPWCGI